MPSIRSAVLLCSAGSSALPSASAASIHRALHCVCATSGSKSSVSLSRVHLGGSSGRPPRAKPSPAQRLDLLSQSESALCLGGDSCAAGFDRYWRSLSPHSPEEIGRSGPVQAYIPIRNRHWALAWPTWRPVPHKASDTLTRNPWDEERRRTRCQEARDAVLVAVARLRHRQHPHRVVVHGAGRAMSDSAVGEEKRDSPEVTGNTKEPLSQRLGSQLNKPGFNRLRTLNPTVLIPKQTLNE